MGTRQTKHFADRGVKADGRSPSLVPVSRRSHLPGRRPSLRSRAALRARPRLCAQPWGSVWWAASSHVPGHISALMLGSVGCCRSTFRYMQCIDLDVAMCACWEQLEG